MNMKRAALAGLALAALPATAMAQSATTATQDVSVTAQVPKYCKFDAIQPLSGDVNINAGSSNMALGTSTVSILNPTDTSGIVQDFAFTFTADAICNYPSQVEISSLNGGLKDGTPTAIASGVFLNRIDYQASAKWAGSAAAGITTSGTPVTSSPPRLVGTAKVGQVVVDVTAVVNNTAPLAAGDYTDTLRISLTPQ